MALNKAPNIKRTVQVSSPKNNPVDISLYSLIHMGVSENSGTPKSSILIGFSIIFTIHFGVYTIIYGNIHIGILIMAYFHWHCSSHLCLGSSFWVITTIDWDSIFRSWPHSRRFPRFLRQQFEQKTVDFGWAGFISSL